MMNKKGISIIICCYNSADRLPQTLASIAKQQQVEFDWEVIIVNNASTDRTTEVAKTEWEKHKVDAGFEIVEQPIPGLSAAREKGVSVSQYEYILFCDDDNWLKEDFLAVSYQIMEENPQVGILGGQSHAVSDTNLPDWFFEKSMVFAVGKQASTSGPMDDINQCLYGACMVVRQCALHVLNGNGFKFLNTGRFGDKLSGGEDTELGKAFRMAGYQLYYDDRLEFNHFIPDSRVNWSYFLKLGKGSASSGVPIFVYDCFLKYHKLGVLKFAWLYALNIVQLLLKILKRSTTLYRYFLKKNREGDLEYFELMRLIEAIRTFTIRFTFGLYCFKKIKNLNENISRVPLFMAPSEELKARPRNQ